jgi:hypothetical protein
MKLLAMLNRFSETLRRAICMFFVVPLCLIGVPIGLWQLSDSYDSYAGLSHRGTEAVAQIQSLTRTGGRVERVVVTSSFVAIDGQKYLANASVYPSEAYRWRTGQAIKIIYDRDSPSNNALSLAAARNKVWAGAFFGLLASGGLMLCLWMFRDAYWSLWARIRTFASSMEGPRQQRG